MKVEPKRLWFVEPQEVADHDGNTWHSIVDPNGNRIALVLEAENVPVLVNAPGLLEACDAVEQELTDLERRLPDGPRYICLPMLRAAIAKAGR